MRYFIGFLITIGLIILLIVLMLTGGGNKKSPQTGQKPRTVNELASYADTNASAQMIIDGRINADQDHTAIRVTIDNTDVTFEQIQGYQGTVVNRQTFKNNTSAYSNFLYAIGRAGFLLGDDSSRLANEKGYCPLGRRIIFTFTQGGQNLERYWGTSCGSGAPKTYKGNLGLTVNLFQLQVPNYPELTSNLPNF